MTEKTVSAEKTIKTVVFETEPAFQVLTNPARVVKQQVVNENFLSYVSSLSLW